MTTAVRPDSVPRFRLRDGETIPAIGLGTFGSDHYSPDQVSEAVYGALKAGYRLLDCAQVYGNEAEIGQVLRRAFDEGMVQRESLFITSKVWNDMHGPGDVLLALARTLRDLGLEAIDAYFVHWPFPNYHAPGCDGDSRNPDSRPFDAGEYIAVWRQMERLHDMGLVRHLGMSNMTVAKLEAVLPHCRIQPSLLELELHPSFQQRQLLAYCRQHQIQPMGFCPLGSPNRPERDRTCEDVNDMELPEVLEVARRHQIHPALVCLKWQVAIGALPIPFSSRPANYLANLRCVTEAPLTPEELAILEGAERGCRLIKGQVFLWPGAVDWREIWE